MSAYDENPSISIGPAKPNTKIYCMICGEGDRVPGMLVCNAHLEEAKARYIGFDRPANRGLFVVNVKPSHGRPA
jgi:hypothetical protein